MYDAAGLVDPPLQRARGDLHVSLKRRGAATVLDGLRQAGCLKVRLPRPVVDGWADVVTLNTGGGIAGGDRLDSAFDVQPGARVTIAAQAAERFYRALPGSAPSRVRTRITVAEDAAAEWLPQETILFDRCAMDRRLDVELADSAWFVGVESLVFGRTAMGERVHRARLSDLIRVRRDGRLLLHDAMRLEGEVDALLRRKPIAGGACAVATVLHVAPDAEARLAVVREALLRPPLPLAEDATVRGVAGEGATTRPSESAASAWDGLLLARILAPDGAGLRGAVSRVLMALRAPRPLPRVWLC